jgi:hypothetical protein
MKRLFLALLVLSVSTGCYQSTADAWMGSDVGNDLREPAPDVMMDEYQEENEAIL